MAKIDKVIWVWVIIFLISIGIGTTQIVSKDDSIPPRPCVFYEDGKAFLETPSSAYIDRYGGKWFRIQELQGHPSEAWIKEMGYELCPSIKTWLFVILQSAWFATILSFIWHAPKALFSRATRKKK